jgi:hypothetical protein
MRIHVHTHTHTYTHTTFPFDRECYRYYRITVGDPNGVSQVSSISANEEGGFGRGFSGRYLAVSPIERKVLEHPAFNLFVSPSIRRRIIKSQKSKRSLIRQFCSGLVQITPRAKKCKSSLFPSFLFSLQSEMCHLQYRRLV